MTFRIGKTEVRLSLGVFPLFAALIVIGEGKSLAIALLSLLLHELSHIIAAKNLGFAIRRVSIYPFGAVLHMDALRTAPQGDAVAALAGPVGSLVIASALRLVAHLMPHHAAALDPFVHTNAALALLNLLPAYPLDGGRAAKSLLLRLLPARTSRTVSLLFTALIAALMITLGVWCIKKGMPAWTLFGIAPYLLISAWIEWKQPSPSVIAHVLERRSARAAGTPIPVQTILINGSATVGAAIQALSNRRFTIFRIDTDRRSMEADEEMLLDAASRFGYDARLKDVFHD